MKVPRKIVYLVAVVSAFAIAQRSFSAGLAPVAHISNIGFVSGLALDGNYLYVAGYPDLRVYDVSDPSKPILAGSLEKAGYLVRMAAANHCIFAPGSSNSVLVYDISSPTKPANASAAIADRREVENVVADLAIINHYAYVIRDGLSVYDVSVPGKLRQLWHTNTSFSSFSSVTIGGNTAYVCNVDQFWMFDLSDPARPKFIGRYPNNINGAKPVAFLLARCAGNFLYAGTSEGLCIYDVSEPAKPARVSERVKISVEIPTSLTVSSTRVFEGNLSAGLRVYDVANPTKPALIATATPRGIPRGTAVKGKYVYFANGGDGVRIYSLNEPVGGSPAP